MPVDDDENLGIAFGLVIGAGLSTALGAAVVFFPSLVRFASRRTLAGALGLSAGVMTYVSFVEIFQKSVGSFEDAGKNEDDAYVYATLCFFGGVVLMVALNYVVTALLGGHHHHHHAPDIHDEKRTRTVSRNSDTPVATPAQQGEGQEKNNPDAGVTVPCCSEDPVRDLENVQTMAVKMQANEEVEGEQQQQQQCCDDSNCDQEEGQCEADEGAAEGDDDRAHHDSQKLMRMSINTAVAIGLHNFPEGLATFVAALDDPAVGGVLALAIAIHNIPEGLCVAMPIYYATGNRWKAFSWALLSGVAEPIAALLGWAVLANSFSDELYAVLFGMVAGMMVIISARELLPTAHRYDPEDSVVTYSFIVGMAIIALSLVLFIL